MSHKGGVGKTTLSTNLAVCAANSGLKTALIDTDKQGSSQFWASLRDPDKVEIKVQSENADSLKTGLIDLRKSGYQVVFIDAPPHFDPASEFIASLSDYMLIPSQPSAVDIHAIATTLDLADKLKKPADIILNNCPHAGTIKQEAVDLILKVMNFPLAPHILHHRIAFSKAYAQGVGVVEYQPVSSAHKAAREMKQLAKWVFAEAGISTK